MPALLLAVLFSPVASGADLPRPADHLEVLSQKIDSLDLLKQNLKRKGAAIAEIEQRQDALRDSVRHFRDNLQRASEATPKTSGEKNLWFFSQKPTNMFDWIIVITGIVASFSGLMLIIGISRSLALKRNRRPRKPEAIHRNSSKPVAEKREKPVAAYPGYEAPPAAPPSPPVIDTGSIHQLRQRLNHQQRAEHFDAPDIPDVQPDPPKPSTMDASDTDTIKKLILDASQNGLDVTSISRKFHLSADHVALILKMAGRQPQSH